MENLVVLSGNSHPEFASRVCECLGINLGGIRIDTFSNENMEVQVQADVGGKDVFVIQTQTPPVNKNIMELFLILDALKRLAPARVTAVIPYLPYSRSDKIDKPGISIGAKLMADLLTISGTHRVLAMDLHAPQIRSFFDIPVDHLEAKPVLCSYLEKFDIKNAVAVAADLGESKGVGGFASWLGLDVAIIDKRRVGNQEKVEPVSLVGNVKRKIAIIFDDEIASAGTVVEGAEFLVKQHGAIEVWCVATHGILSGKAIERLKKSSISKIIVTDTVPMAEEKRISKITQLSVASPFAKAIDYIHQNRSVDCLNKKEEYKRIFV